MAILECRGLCKSYGAEPALDRVDLAIEPGASSVCSARTGAARARSSSWQTVC